MDAITPALFAVGAVNLLMFPLLLWYIKRYLEKFDSKREKARLEQAEAERDAAKQREAERRLTLAMARSQLLENYERCMEKGFYTVDEREVYHELYEAYHKDGGNGIMTDLREKIVELPTEPSHEKKRME